MHAALCGALLFPAAAVAQQADGTGYAGRAETAPPLVAGDAILKTDTVAALSPELAGALSGRLTDPVAPRTRTTLKWNALYWVCGIPNMSVETRLGQRFTFNADLVFSPWESINGRPYVIGQVIPSVRYYFRESFRGFYVGGYAAFDAFEMSKYNHPAYEVQHGVGISLGGVVGYQLPIGRTRASRWSMDFYLMGGWHLAWYYGIDERTGDFYARWNASGEWMPYGAGVTFAYRLGRK